MTTISKLAWLLSRDPQEDAEVHAGVPVRGIGVADSSKLFYNTLLTGLWKHTKLQNLSWSLQDQARSILDVSQNLRVKDAINSVGFWNGDFNTGFYTLHRVALSNFYVDNQRRKYLFWRNSRNQGLYYTYNDCDTLYSVSQTIYGDSDCPWQTPTQLATTIAGPSSVVYDDKLWVFYTSGVNNNVYFFTLDKWGNWTEENMDLVGMFETDRGPSAVSYDGYLYLFYKHIGDGNQEIGYTRWSPSTGWDGPYYVGQNASSPSRYKTVEAPTAVGPLGGLLYLLYKPYINYVPSDPNESIYIRWTTIPSSTEHQNWSEYEPLYFPLPEGAPGAAIFKGRLHIAARTRNDQYHYRSLCPFETDCTFNKGTTTGIVRPRPSMYSLPPFEPMPGSAFGEVTLFADESDLEPYLYAFTPGYWENAIQTRDALVWKSKASE